VSKRLPPAERLRVEIDGVFAGGEDLAGAIERVAQLGARLLLQAALEAEVAPFLGRDRYERAAACEDPRTGMRNGYCPTTVKTTAGPITLERPKRRGTTEQFASQLFGKGVTKTNALESLVIAGFVRGLSTRDVQATLTEALGKSGRCPSRQCRASAPTSRSSSTPGADAGSMMSSWATCSWTAAISNTTPTLL
jgi:putative transposase